MAAAMNVVATFLAFLAFLASSATWDSSTSSVSPVERSVARDTPASQPPKKPLLYNGYKRTAQRNDQEEQADELVCYRGLVMDTYCVELGYLLDNPSVETLRNPQLHSYYCLVDVQRCIDGGFEMLADLTGTSGGMWGRFLRIDAIGTGMLVDLARATGSPSVCSSCTGTLGNETMGFQATVVGTLVPGSALPQLLATQQVLPYADGCPEGATVISPNDDNVSLDAGGAQSKVLAHGSLMLVSWGFVLPLGVITARFLRYRPNGLWFQMHRVLQSFGLVLAVAGWAVALKSFTILGSGIGSGSSLERQAYAHAVCGTAVMCIGLLQPLNAILRPHFDPNDDAADNDDDNASKHTNRTIWELVHKGMGYIATILAFATIGLGTRIVGTFQKQFLAGFIASLVVLAVASFSMVVDKVRFSKRNTSGMEKQERCTSHQSSMSNHEPETDPVHA